MRGSLIALSLAVASPAFTADRIPNPQIDYPGFASQVAEVGRVRESRRVTETEFIAMAADRGTVVLDARSTERFGQLHVKGAKHLSFPDFTEAALAAIVPNKSTRILIYCNNNFLNEPSAFALKVAPAALNIHTMNALYAYGYKNVYELGPAIDIYGTRIPFEGRSAGQVASRR